MNRKIRKFISLSLIASILFMNTPTNALAGTLSEDTRYETFEGNDIVINDILEEDEVDVEIEGNTLVNIIDYTEKASSSSYWIYDYNSGSISIAQATGTFKGVNYNTIKPFEINKDYTLFINITKNTMENISQPGGNVIKFALGRDYGSNNIAFVSENQSGIFKYVFRPEQIDIEKPYITCLPDSEGEFAFEDFMIIEGNHLDKDIEFFEGMKSVAELENNNLHIENIGENLFDVEYFKDCIEKNYENGNYGYETKDGRNTVWTVNNNSRLHGKNLLSNNYKFKENTQYIIKSEVFLDINNPTTYNTLRGQVVYTDGSSKAIFYSNGSAKGSWDANTVITDKNKTIEKITFTYGDNSSKGWINLDSLYIGEYRENKVKYNYDYNINNIKIALSEPLRGIPGGIADRIIKMNGQWFIERNCKELVLDGSSKYSFAINYFKGPNADTSNFSISVKNDDSVKESEDGDILSDRIPQGKGRYVYRDGFSISTYVDGTALFVGTIPNSYLDTIDVTGLIKYFNENPSSIIYQLAKPVYEPLNIDSTLNLYLGSTYIYNSSNIPANMKITVDRVANRAKEFIEVANLNPTVENMSQARYWINLMNDSILKDEFQSELNDVSEIEDLAIEKKTVSANVDVYIAMKNTLSMSLDTNSISFTDYSGSEDLEMLKAVNITIDSSLPYNLNAYMPTGIYNSDKTKSMDINVLNLRESTESVYKQFTSINEKLVLKENCSEGEARVHSIDLKLSGGNTYKADVYKTVLKFEAEQK